MSIQRIETGPRMSQAVIHNKTVYLAGQVAGDDAGAGVYEETRSILANIDRLLAAAGSDKSRLLERHHLADRHGQLRRHEPRLGSLGGARRHAGARHGHEPAPGGAKYHVEIGVVAAQG
jgi:enamine deaminase RidA (YjgF/YER057c/UK114 family)